MNVVIKKKKVIGIQMIPPVKYVKSAAKTFYASLEMCLQICIFLLKFDDVALNIIFLLIFK